MLSQKEKLYVKLCAKRTKRSSNFTVEEVKRLLQLVDNKKGIIESKKADRTASEEKLKAWLEIEVEFNAAFEDYRSYKVLKTKYENLKKNLKRELSVNESNISLLKRMQANINALEDTQFSDHNHNANTDDDDTCNKSYTSDIDIKPHAPLDENELNAAAEQYVFETLLLDDPQTSTSQIQTNSSKQNECQVQEKTTKEKSSVDIWEQVAHKKIKKLDLEINVIEDEWKLRKRKMELEIESIQIENRFKEEKIKLELEILRQKLQN